MFAGYVLWRYFWLGRVRLEGTNPEEMLGLFCIGLRTLVACGVHFEFEREIGRSLDRVCLVRRVVLGVAARVAMRLVAIDADVRPAFSLGGTTEIVLLGVIVGSPTR